MTILLINTMGYAVPVIENLLEKGFTILLITVDPESDRGKSISGITELGQLQHPKLTVFYQEDVRLRRLPVRLKECLSSSDISHAFCLSWHWIIDPSFLRLFPLGVFGWHGSMFRLPHGSGRSPINWSIRLGAREVWMTCFQYSEIADHGPVFNQTSIAIEKADHVGDVLKKVARTMITDVEALIATADKSIVLSNRTITTA